eukprot:355232-Chlamydomonas_euryale.AAC.5
MLDRSFLRPRPRSYARAAVAAAALCKGTTHSDANNHNYCCSSGRGEHPALRSMLRSGPDSEGAHGAGQPQGRVGGGRGRERGCSCTMPPRCRACLARTPL